VVRASETDFRLVECFDAATNACTLTPDCRLKHLFDQALQGYFAALDRATLADLTAGPPAGGPPRLAAVTMPASRRPPPRARLPTRAR
jgi:Rrf2 family transcriptional regulator, nitric oxide-sensitive transcriptional repressor